MVSVKREYNIAQIFAFHIYFLYYVMFPQYQNIVLKFYDWTNWPAHEKNIYSGILCVDLKFSIGFVLAVVLLSSWITQQINQWSTLIGK